MIYRNPPPLADYGLSNETGFLSPAPLRSLPAAFAAWEEAAAELPAWLHAGRSRDLLAPLPLLDPAGLPPGPAQERAHRLLSLFAHAWVSESGGAGARLPYPIASPWDQLSRQLVRPPVVSHASLVLSNWRKLDPAGGFGPENLAPLHMFLGGQDEAWFYTVTMAIEAEGGPALQAMLDGWQAAAQGSGAALAQALEALLAALRRMTALLGRMQERCDPHTFYLRLRPLLASFVNVRYEGCEPPLRSYPGGSAAQSSLIQLLDAFLGIAHPPGPPGDYLRQMRQHMPALHRAFLQRWEAEWPGLPPGLAPEAALACREEMLRFRSAHFRLAAAYIIGPAARQQEHPEGTGGSDVQGFLHSLREDVVRSLPKKEPGN
jgi:indoleamine 2,3-dioxygenase